MLGYFIKTSEYPVIFMQAKDDYASRNQQDYILKSKSFSNLRSLEEVSLPYCYKKYV